MESPQTTPTPGKPPLRRKGEQTRRRIVDAAAELFHARGVDGTGLDAILRRAGAGKSQFYQHFRNKDALVEAVLGDFEARLEASMTPLREEVATLAALERWLLGFIEELEALHCRRGCPAGTIVAGLHESEDGYREAVKTCFGGVEAALTPVIADLQARGEIAATAPPASLAAFVMALQQGAATLTKAQGDTAPAREAIRQAVALLRGGASA
ncbi:TetR/AcrR family transcriptional regulator [Modicisalibacter tunisiensis]|uniref:TetR/AcrR family transcriptional regulator n=1 Tax=Modicisalibacter tunisiensis TaxID=390637 RepID=A0ABS7WWL6_9GAMM|nr:TetR/AcrR family transcriptional regulator [Modicisalibacter tunisiensis]MBZ9567005.1 TetR/AcrR family transcriptional regulator [Modicisalibacter tunisiensis]